MPKAVHVRMTFPKLKGRRVKVTKELEDFLRLNFPGSIISIDTNGNSANYSHQFYYLTDMDNEGPRSTIIGDKLYKNKSVIKVALIEMKEKGREEISIYYGVSPLSIIR
jgi:hypothetical protein